MDDVYPGFDPGGDRGFGVAILRGSDARAATVSAVSQAIDWALKMCGTNEPMAAGIDTMLHWSDGPGGWRPADRKLRFAYPEVGECPQSKRLIWFDGYRRHDSGASAPQAMAKNIAE